MITGDWSMSLRPNRFMPKARQKNKSTVSRANCNSFLLDDGGRHLTEGRYFRIARRWRRGLAPIFMT
eukprot:scaffold209938_cov25-Prasinocladus_malaysianus.AAC.1